MKQNFKYLLGQRLKQLRHKMDMERIDFAAEANISENTLGKLERGDTDPQLSTLIKVAEGLNMDLTQLIGEAEYEPLIRSPELRELVDLLNSQDKETIKYILGITKTMISLKKQSK